MSVNRKTNVKLLLDPPFRRCQFGALCPRPQSVGSSNCRWVTGEPPYRLVPLKCHAPVTPCHGSVTGEASKNPYISAFGTVSPLYTPTRGGPPPLPRRSR